MKGVRSSIARGTANGNPKITIMRKVASVIFSLALRKVEYLHPTIIKIRVRLSKRIQS